MTAVARDRMDRHMKDLAAWAGASEVTVNMEVEDRKLLLKNGRTLHMGACLTFTVGQDAGC